MPHIHLLPWHRRKLNTYIILNGSLLRKQAAVLFVFEAKQFFKQIFFQVSDGQLVRAHKLVLSACSPMFRTMLKKNDHPKPIIYLHGVRYTDIKAILNFMYRGEVNINQEDLNTFLAAAEELRVRGLSQNDLQDRMEDRANVN